MIRVCIVGGGRTGTHLAGRLDSIGVNTKVIEKDRHQYARLSETQAHVIVINVGDIIIPRGDRLIRPKGHLMIFALHEKLPRPGKLITVKLEYF